MSQPWLCAVELASYSKSATAACSANRTSGSCACSIPALAAVIALSGIMHANSGAAVQPITSNATAMTPTRRMM